MIFLIFLFTIKANAEVSTKEVINILKSSKDERSLFISDTKVGRNRFESFQEEKFIPAVNKMISVLNTKDCVNCLELYLNALESLEGSANEEINEQLGRILSNNTAQLEFACKSRSSKIKKNMRKRIDEIIKKNNWIENHSKVQLAIYKRMCS